MPAPTVPSAHLSIADLQRILSLLGFYRTPEPSGRWDHDTQAALQAFLAKHGVPDKGLVSPDQFMTRAAQDEVAILETIGDRLRDEVAALQLQLKVLGAYDGNINGLADDATIRAAHGYAEKSGAGQPILPLDASIRDKLERESCASFEDVLSIELDEIERARPPYLKRGGTDGIDTIGRAHDAQLSGLAFSGGGIRSATFNLGVLQALSELKLLHIFDYLSSVSGGGYIGSWLSALIKRRAGGDPFQAAREIRPGWYGALSGEESSAIRFLRSYSNYLTPRLGALSLDTLAAVATYLRNLYLNLLILVLVLAAVLIIPRVLVVVLPGVFESSSAEPFQLNLLLGLGLLLLLLATPIAGLNLAYRRPAVDSPIPWFAKKLWIGVLFWIPMTAGAYLLGYWFGVQPSGCHFQPESCLLTPELCALKPDLFDSQPRQCEIRWWFWMSGGAATYLLACALGLAGYWYARQRYPADRPLGEYPDRFGPIPLLIWAAVSGVIGGLVMLGFTGVLANLTPKNYPQVARWVAAGCGALIIVFVVSLVVTLHIGLMGRRYTEQAREWWSRLGGTSLLFAAAWIGIFAVSIYAPFAIALAEATWSAGAIGTWISITLTGVLLGQSRATGGPHVKQILDVIARVAPYVFILGMLVAVSWLLDWGLAAIADAPTVCEDRKAGAFSILDFKSCTMSKFEWWELLLAAIGLFALGLIISWRVDINLFSIYNFYRNRLTRAYLGATRVEQRKPQPFTGFDPHDDLPLHSLRQDREAEGFVWQRPYHIVNTALNLVQGEALEWQQRKAAPFSFAPHFTGFELPPTMEAAAEESQPAVEATPPGLHEDASARLGRHRKPSRGCYRPTLRTWGHGGVPLGSALAISGAAASPSMGYHSAPALAFLMTVFNVRLGRWCGNPADREAWRLRSPRLSARYLFDELLGMTNSRTPFVYLSDGGHFENLGIYELVRRRCRFILSCDAGQDARLEFTDLGNAIRKCQADLGIPIEIDVGPIRLQGEGKRSTWHCAIGRIRYDYADPFAVPGTLLYLKPSLLGDEPTDILQYAAVEKTFPHQSTGDQWFDEAQFESYRKLGYHIGLQVMRKAKEVAEADRQAAGPFADVEGLVVGLQQQWQPPAKGSAEAFSRHAETLDAIYERLRSDPQLRFLDAQIYPNWESLVTGQKYSAPNEQWLPDSYAELREGFYLCNSVMQLIENAYLDLKLETEHDHPDNRGWMNLFRHWSWCNMFRVTWAMCASTYGARFQSFCARQLGLEPGKVEVRPQEFSEGLASGALNFLEQELVRCLLIQHPDLQPEKLILYLIEVVVRDPQESGKEIRMRVGIAIGSAAEVDKDLVFLRIQDHLRRMGLARRALRVMLGADLGIARAEPRYLMPPAPETIGEIEVREFERLFRSVQYEKLGGSRAA